MTESQINQLPKSDSLTKTGVLLLSLGTPDAPTYWSVRKYLAEFLADPRVIETPRAIWLPILYGIILTFRPFKAAKAYAEIWDKEKNQSPLRLYAQSQSDKLQDRLGGAIEVAWAFRYGQPSIKSAVTSLHEKGCDRILAFALYPQYSATSMATAYDKLFDALRDLRWQPAVRTVPAYYNNPLFIERLAQSVKQSLEGLNWKPEKLLVSYHSIPKAYADKGDPYPEQCLATSELLSSALGMDDGTLVTSFQSRVGPAEWVSPYTDKTVEEMAANGVKKLAVLAPAFSADCLETLEEINMELRETFLEAGGTHFHYIPCLNDTEGGMDVIEEMVRSEGAGWLGS